LAKIQSKNLGFGQNSFFWPNKVRRKTQKKESSAEKHINFADEINDVERKNNSLDDTKINKRCTTILKKLRL